MRGECTGMTIEENLALASPVREDGFHIPTSVRKENALRGRIEETGYWSCRTDCSHPVGLVRRWTGSSALDTSDGDNEAAETSVFWMNIWQHLILAQQEKVLNLTRRIVEEHQSYPSV